MRVFRYGFAWPARFDCDHFPGDDNLCVRGKEEPAPTTTTTTASAAPPVSWVTVTLSHINSRGQCKYTFIYAFTCLHQVKLKFKQEFNYWLECTCIMKGFIA